MLLTGLTQPSQTSKSPTQLPTVFSSEILSIIVANGESIPSITATYFRTIGLWLFSIYPEQIQRALDSEISHDLSILLLCMHLVISVPGNSKGFESVSNSTYFQAKSIYSLRASSGKPSVEIVQAGALLSLYEYGHGMVEAAQLTLATASTMSIKMVKHQRKIQTHKIEDTDIGHLWWGVVMLDRYVSMF